MTFGLLYWLVAGSLIVLMLIRQHKSDQAWMAEHLAWAEQEFCKVRLHSASPYLHLDVKTATVMDDKPEVIADGNQNFKEYTLTRIVRNESGEYFWLHFDTLNDAKVIVKHIGHPSAKALLKEKYIEPGDE